MRDKIFEFIDPEDPLRGNFNPEVVRMTGEEILNSYYPYWSDKMDEKFGVGRDKTNDIKECIEDFCVVNWATEVRDETKSRVVS